MTEHFADVTELAGTQISTEQLERMSHRYHWAAQFCSGKDVVEVACGSGQGLGILAAASANVEAGDISPKILEIPRRHYGSRIRLDEFDAQALPFADRSKDVIILFEAIYYVPDAGRFVDECRRVLRLGGCVLVATANKDLPDFNPSPHSHRYYGAAELHLLFRERGFGVELFGHLPVASVSWRQRMLRPVKQLAVALNLVPKTMTGKKLIKRLVFGRLVPMPAELPYISAATTPLSRLELGLPDLKHKVLYACATLRC